VVDFHSLFRVRFLLFGMNLTPKKSENKVCEIKFSIEGGGGEKLSCDDEHFIFQVDALKRFEGLH